MSIEKTLKKTKRAVTFFFGRIVQTSVNKQKGIIEYGRKNSLPSDNLKLIQDSGIATRCAGKLRKYIKAFGWDTEGTKVINTEGQTTNQLLADMAGQMSYFKGVALMVRRNIKGEIKSVETISFQGVRKKTDGTFDYNPKAGTKDFMEKQTMNFQAFRGASITPEEMEAHIKEHGNKGEIFYFYEKTVVDPIYPIPEYYGGVEDIKTSAELQRLDLEAVLNGFLPSSILVTEEYDDDEEDETGKTRADHMEDEIKMFTGMVQDKDGITGRMKLLWIQVKSEEQAPQLQTYDAKAIIDASIEKRDAIERSVCRLFTLHPVLLGYSEPQVLGNQQAFANAMNETINEVDDSQKLIEENMKKIFPKVDWHINRFNVINYIPSEVWDVLTVDEKRAVGGYLPDETITNDTTD